MSAHDHNLPRKQDENKTRSPTKEPATSENTEPPPPETPSGDPEATNEGTVSDEGRAEKEKDESREDERHGDDPSDDANDPEVQNAGESDPQKADPERESPENKGHQRVLSDPEEFDSRSFLASVNDLHNKLRKESYHQIDENFPADELKEMVEAVTSTMENFKRYANHTQQELEKVREQMRDIKTKIYKRIQAKGYDPKSASEKKSVEERELEAKLAELNKEVAKAAEELVRASQLTADTEAAAVEASLAAEQAAAEARRIQEEYEARKRAEEERRKAEEERREAERRRREEEERRQEELRRAEEEKKAKLRKNEENKPAEWENWPTFTYNADGSEFAQGIGCLVRGDPDKFQESSLAVELVDPLETKNLLGDYEELVSDIIKIYSAHGDEELQSSVYIAIPHCTSRTSAISREPVMKAEVDGKWEDLKTHDITIESKKDVKFVQAEVSTFTTLCVVTRYKRDFLHLSRKGGKISSNVDARVTFSADRGTFKKTENFVLQMQHVDSATINRIKERSTEASKLLTCSAIVNMEWASETFSQPVYMTLPCPPNPVKAKKAAAARAAKEAKMKNPQMQQVQMEDDKQAKRQERKKTKPAGRQKQVATTDDDDERPTTASVTKWYMGQYGNNEDDENDLLYFLKKLPNNKWTVLENMSVVQVKLDLLQIQLEEPLQTFMVLRTRTNADAQDAQNLAETIESCLKERVVGVIIRQKIENQCEVVMAVVPLTRLEKALNQFDDEGYEPGVVSNNQEQKDAAIKILNEGDVLEISFTGNIKCQDPDAKLAFVFHSQLNSQLRFPIIEVDKYLQKGYSEYRGFVQILKRWEVLHIPTKKEESEGESEPWVEVKRELISKHLVKVPKEEEPSPRPIQKAPIKIKSDHYSLDDATLRHVAQCLGDEWLRVAHYLNVKRQRIQAILRNNIHGDDDDVKYDMLITWIKRVPRRINKTEILINALMYANRPDLVNELREQEREYQRRRRAALGSRQSVRSAPSANRTYSTRSIDEQ